MTQVQKSQKIDKNYNVQALSFILFLESSAAYEKKNKFKNKMKK